MKKIIGLSVSIIIVWLIYPIASNAETGLRVKGLLWDSKIDGKIKSDKGSLTGTEIDLKDTLGVTRSSTVPEFEGKFNFLGMSRLIISYMPASYEGTKNIAQDVSFAGKTFAVSERLKTNLDISIGSVLYESLSLENPASGMAPVEPDLGLLLGIKYFHVDGKVTSSTTAMTVNKTLGAPIPVIGLRIQEALLEKAQIELTYTFMNIKTSGINVSWSDLYTELKLNLVQNLPFGVGYKLTKVNFQNDNDPEFLSRFKFDGLYAIASLNF